MSEPVDLVLSKLSKVQKTGAGWMAACPCRDDDQNPSLAVGVGSDGRVLLNCHRGTCGVERICESMDLKVADLYPNKAKDSKLRLTHTWNYTDLDGKQLFQKLRFVDEAGRKTFRQRRSDGVGGWVYNLTGVDKVLYRLPQVREAIEAGADVWVVEGEKDVEAVVKTGRCATTMPGGAGKWLPEFTQSLSGANRVVIVADNDDVGVEHAWHVADELAKVNVPTLLLHSPVGKDVDDLISAGREISELVKLTRPLQVSLGDDLLGRLIGELVELAESDAPLQVKLGKARSVLDAAESDSEVSTGRLTTWDQFVAESDDDSYDWLIPQLLERDERVIVVAPEGVGKSMLARQVALCCAAGVHPFTYADMPPVKTLYVDLENPERIIRRTSRKIVSAVHHRSGRRDPIEAHLFSKPDGLNLLDPADRVQLEQVIQVVEPELICLGPLYKSFIDPGGRTSESIAIEVAKYLDYVRTLYGAALWLEHHAPLGSSGSRDLRPFGSAVWSRWPEFGITLEQDATVPGEYIVGAFRGARDERAWPKRMKRGDYLPFEIVSYD